MRRAITRVMVSVLGVVCVTVALVGLAQAIAQPREPRHTLGLWCYLLTTWASVWVLDTTTALRWQRTPGIPPPLDPPTTRRPTPGMRRPGIQNNYLPMFVRSNWAMGRVCRRSTSCSAWWITA